MRKDGKTGYPRPRYPKFKRISAKKLAEKIRSIVEQPVIEGLEHQPHVPRYGIKKGDKVLVIALTEYDQVVVNEYVNAAKGCGAAVDLLLLDSTPEMPADRIAVAEAMSIAPLGDKERIYTRITNLINPKVVTAMVESEGYDLVIAGTAGPIPRVPYRWTRMQYISQEEFSSPQIDFPFDLQKLIDDKVYEAIKSFESVRITDPEGTDLSFTNYDDKRPQAMIHEYGKPINFGFGGREDCSGVVAGTLNHLGAFPHCKAIIKDGLVVDVEGGGEYGKVWREKIQEYNNIDFPEYPIRSAMALPGEEVPKIKMDRKGFFWFWECAIGTTPGVFRLESEGKMQCFANFLHDRKRSGYLHHGFGGANNSASALMKAGLPWTHVHIHNMFATYEGTTKDGTKVKVIDKGHLTALDNPDVRKLAKKYGNPDKLLSEVWIPAVPGINVKGSYEKYASNPSKWITQDAALHPVLRA